MNEYAYVCVQKHFSVSKFPGLFINIANFWCAYSKHAHRVDLTSFWITKDIYIPCLCIAITRMQIKIGEKEKISFSRDIYSLVNTHLPFGFLRL